MRALIYRRSVPLYLLNRWMAGTGSRRFFPAFSPVRLAEEVFQPRAGWVVLAPRLCGICGSDLNLLRGRESFLLEPYGSFPAVLGHEVVAEVVDAPPDAGWSTGRRVVVKPLLCCEVRGLPPCRYCAREEHNLCERFAEGVLPPGASAGYTAGFCGGMAERMNVHPRQLVEVPDTMSDETAVLCDPLACALQALLPHFPADGDRVVIVGAGIMGQLLLRALRALGSASQVTVVARHGFQKRLAEQGGASRVIGSCTRTALAEATGGRLLPTRLGGGNVEGGADAVFDCVGSTATLREALPALRAKGRLVLVGSAAKVGPIDWSSIWFREVRVAGSAFAGRTSFGGETIGTHERALGLLRTRPDLWQGLLTHSFPLQDYARAFRCAFDKPRFQSMKVAFRL